jgi:hypothetical protein
MIPSGQGQQADARAELLLHDVLGEERYGQFRALGYLDIPSRLRPGRVYRLDRMGNLAYRDPGERTFNTTLCVQPAEPVPRDDEVAMRYLLVTSDEERLLKVANPINFSLVSLARSSYHSFSERHPPALAWLYTAALLGFFLVALALQLWVVFFVSGQQPVAAVIAFVTLLAPALIGLILVAAGLADVWRALRLRLARRTGSRPG